MTLNQKSFFSGEVLTGLSEWWIISHTKVVFPSSKVLIGTTRKFDCGCLCCTWHFTLKKNTHKKPSLSVLISPCFSLQKQKIFFEEKCLTLKKNNAHSQGSHHLNSLTICVALNVAAHTPVLGIRNASG